MSVYYSDFSTLVDPSQLLQESKTIYTQYVEAITESERLDALNSEYHSKTPSYCRMRQQVLQLQSANKQKSSTESENSSLRKEIARLVRSTASRSPAERAQRLPRRRAEAVNPSLFSLPSSKDDELKSLGELLASLSATHEENVRLQLQIATLVSIECTPSRPEQRDQRVLLRDEQRGSRREWLGDHAASRVPPRPNRPAERRAPQRERSEPNRRGTPQTNRRILRAEGRRLRKPDRAAQHRNRTPSHQPRVAP